jgi:hypothetical protein
MAGLIQIFYDPAAVFAKVRERGSWALPLIATALITVIFAYYVSHTIGMENVTRRFFEQHPSFGSQLPPDKLEQAIHQSATPARLALGAFFAGVATVISALVNAVVLLVILAIMDRKPKFSQILGTVAWSTYPFAVIAAVMSALILAISRDPTELDPQTLLATNVGAFLDQNSTGKFLYSLAGSVDALAIGKIFLLAFGISKVTGMSFGSALTLLIVLWLVWVLLRGGFAVAFGF